MHSRQRTIPLGFGFRVGPLTMVFLLGVLAIEVNAVLEGRYLGALLIVGILGLMWGPGIYGLARVRAGHHSWMYPELTANALDTRLAEDYPSLGLTRVEAEVLRWWLDDRGAHGRPRHQHVDAASFGYSWPNGIMGCFRGSARDERLLAIETLRTRGWLKTLRTSPVDDDFLGIDLRHASQAMRGAWPSASPLGARDPEETAAAVVERFHAKAEANTVERETVMEREPDLATTMFKRRRQADPQASDTDSEPGAILADDPHGTAPDGRIDVPGCESTPTGRTDPSTDGR